MITFGNSVFLITVVRNSTLWRNINTFVGGLKTYVAEIVTIPVIAEKINRKQYDPRSKNEFIE